MTAKQFLIGLLLIATSLWAKEGDFTKYYELALKGDKAAQYNVGVLYELGGNGVKIDAVKAATWYERSALQGHKDAQFNIAVMYKEGFGVKKDLTKAKTWFEKAAAQGDTEAAEILKQLAEKPTIQSSLQAATEQSASSTSEALVSIKPTTLKVLDGAMICPQYGATQNCEKLKKGSIVTSISKKGSWYKISGTVSVNEGFKSYPKEGWIEESVVEVRK